VALRITLCATRLPTPEKSTSFSKQFIEDLCEKMKNIKIVKFQQQKTFANVKNNRTIVSQRKNEEAPRG
jgi:hypothetical protein